MFKRLTVLSIILVVCLGLAVNITSARAGTPLPALPDAAVIENIRATHAGGTFTPLGAPTFVTNRLATLTGVFAGVQNLVSTPQAVYYFDVSTGRLREGLLPLINSQTAILAPDFWTPGSGSKPGKIVGVIFQPNRGSAQSVMVMVATWKSDQWGCTNCNPEKLRLYHNSTQYFEVKIDKKQFVDINGDLMIEDVDAGAVLSHKASCVTVGLQQVCWKPGKDTQARDKTTPKGLMEAATQRALGTYNLTIEFYKDDAVPDVLGFAQRYACAAALTNAVNFASIPECAATAIISATKTVAPGQPTALIITLQAIELSTYDTAGNFVGQLPAGEYLVIDATPSITTSGQSVVSFLVNINSGTHYLLPGVRMQGFGVDGVDDPREAGIKDGFAGYVGWGC